jgi:protease PrsW
MKIAVSLIPVLLFLVLFVFLDCFKLVNKKVLLLCVCWGVMSAAASFFLNTFLIQHTQLEFSYYSGFIAPFPEELLKMTFLIFLIKGNRVGFMIDGAIYGFAIGSGFALTENLFYLYHFAGEEADLMLWITRGFGTAIMHGGATAIVGVLGMSSLNRQINPAFSIIMGALSAIFLHMVYNFFLFPPLISALVIFFLVPGVLAFLFRKNEQTIRDWLEMEFDTEVKILGMIRKGKFSETKAGSYLVSIKKHFPAETVLDLYCFIGLYLELSIKAKSIMMLRENDLPVKHETDLAEKLAELQDLRRNIGKAGMLAISPILRIGRKDRWKLSILD